MSILPLLVVVRPNALGLIVFSLFVCSGLRGETASSFEGTVSATLSRGESSPSHVEFTRKGNLLRIENTTSKLEPINIVDLVANRLTIIYPHNTTFVHVDLTNKPGAVAGVADPGAAVNDHGYNKKMSPPPGFPTPPPMPQMPIGGPPVGAGGPPALPRQMTMPPMPAMGGFGGTPELKKTDKTKKIQGLDCTLYTIGDRMETFEIWATNDSVLFPFRLIERDFLGHRFGPPMIEEQWVELLRSKSLFPMEATLRMEGANQERLSFKVDKIDSPSRTGGSKIDNDALFRPPENYQEIQAPQF